MAIHSESVVVLCIPDYNRAMHAGHLHRILSFCMVLGVSGVSFLAANDAEQNLTLRSRSQPKTPIDYTIGSLADIDTTTRGVIRAAVAYVYAGDMDAFMSLVVPDSQHRLRERFREAEVAVDEQDAVEDAVNAADAADMLDGIRISPVGEGRAGAAVQNDDAGERRRGYVVRVIQGRSATTGEAWIVVGSTGPMIDDLVIDFRNREFFGDDTRKFAPGGARTGW
ncbi:MAG: hypothetical protein LC641_12560 [Spirochaeta sp.]|nr:hypothetical protein [Spirochaeta sp.]